MRQSFSIVIALLYLACDDSSKEPALEEDIVVVEQNTDPTLEVLSPTSGEIFFADGTVSLMVQIGDAEDAVMDLQVSLQSDVDGSLDASWQVEDSGLATTSISLTEGEHQLTVAVLDLQGARTEAVLSLEILPANQDPWCQILAPTSQEWFSVGQEVDLMGQVSDSEHMPTELSVEWMSPDGLLAESIPDEQGNVLETVRLNTVGAQVLSMQVADPYGGFCNADVLLNVGIPPVLTLRSPALNDVITLNDIVNLWVDVEDIGPQGTSQETIVRWESDIDGLLFEGQTEGGSSLHSLNTLSAGVHTLTVTATDVETLTASETVELRVNRLPEVQSITLSPDPVYTTDDLVATVVLLDPDLDPLNTIFQWYENGQLTSITGDTVSSTDVHSGDEWRVVVTPNDGYTNGFSQEASVLVSNTVPTVSNVSISPTGTVYNDQTINCAAIVLDPDQTIIPVYEWMIDGTQYISNSIDLSNTVALPGSTVTCTVFATDDEGATTTSSNSIVVGNRAPSVSNVSIDIANPTTNDVLTCSAVIADPDGESLAVEYAWQVSGVTLATGETVNLASLSVNPTDDVTCLVTVEDGLGDTSTDSATTTLQNTAPILNTVNITPAAPTAVDVLTCTATGSDADGEALTPTLEFQHQGATLQTISAWTGQFTPSQNGLGAGDEVVCLATLNDGYGGADQLSDSVTLDSSAPALSNVGITPNSAYTNTVVTCAGSAIDPNDGNLTSVIQYEWSIDGSLISTGASYLIGNGQTNVGDALVCTATVTDSDGESDSASTSILIQNTTPMVNSVSLSPTSVYNDDILLCTGAAVDPDDVPAVSYAWQSAGIPLGTGSSLDLDTTSLMPGDVVECIVTASDVQGSSDTGLASMTISNRTPNVPVLNISWSGNSGTPVAGSVLTCSATAIDPDGQSLTYAYSWQSSSGGTGSGATISSQVQGGETWTCTAIASDGQYTSTASTSVNVLEPCAPDTDYHTLNLGGSNEAELVRVCAGVDGFGRYSISKDIMMMTTEVTQGMFTDLMGYDPTTYGASYGVGADHPVYYVNWHMAADFANQMTFRHNSVEGSNLTQCYSCSDSLTDSVSCSMVSSCTGYRLPTEAEWEYTARVGLTEEFWTADGGGSPNSSACYSPIPIQDGGSNPPLDSFAWYCYNRYNSVYYNTDKPVGLKTANGFGVHDMHGNVAEWTADRAGCTYPVTYVDPLCTFNSPSYVIRGGDWTGNASTIRSSERSDLHGGTRVYKQGFRVAKRL